MLMQQRLKQMEQGPRRRSDCRRRATARKVSHSPISMVSRATPPGVLLLSPARTRSAQGYRSRKYSARMSVFHRKIRPMWNY